MSDLSLVERAEILSKVYAVIKVYFGHWQPILEFDVDAAYHSILEEALLAEDRRAFSLAVTRFVSQLKNGHSFYRDMWLWDQRIPHVFHLQHYDGQWMVMRSVLDEVRPGDIVQHINGRNMEDWYTEIRPYIFASSEREARHHFMDFLRVFLPQRYMLQFDDSRQVEVDHTNMDATRHLPWMSDTQGRWLIDGHTAYIKIPRFNQPHLEIQALDYVQQFQDAKYLIIDVRGNFGGSSPERLVDSLMERPYQYYMEATPALFSLLHYRSQQVSIDDAVKQPDYFDLVRQFSHSSLMWPAQIYHPKNTVFRGKLIILTDGYTGSAAEDFTIPFKNNGRALIMGETTVGSTGQPYILDFHINAVLFISTKRAFFPDGTPFEGVGIRPDVEISPNRGVLRAGRDGVMEAALKHTEEMRV